MSYICIGWSAGLYKVNDTGNMKGGVTLQFVDTETGEDGYWTVFPAEVLRKRGINAGSPLGKNKFRIGSSRCKFYKFWTMCKLPFPRRTNGKIELSGFPDCMGKVKNLHFNADILIAETRKLDNDTLVYLPSEVSNPANVLQLSCKIPANHLQLPRNYPAISSCNELEQEYINSDFEEYSSTYTENPIKDKRLVIKEKDSKHNVSTNNLDNLNSHYIKDKEQSEQATAYKLAKDGY